MSDEHNDFDAVIEHHTQTHTHVLICSYTNVGRPIIVIQKAFKTTSLHFRIHFNKTDSFLRVETNWMVSHKT